MHARIEVDKGLQLNFGQDFQKSKLPFWRNFEHFSVIFQFGDCASEILKNLGAEDSCDSSESGAVEDN